MDSNLEIIVSIPSDPIPEVVTEAIAARIRAIPEIYFAFLPELFIPGQMSEAAPVLVLVTDLDGKELERIIMKLHYEIGELFADNNPIDMLILTADHELVPATISTGCLIEINDQAVFERCNQY